MAQHNHARWRRLRERRIEQTGGRCERCGEGDRYLILHHLNYDRVGAERHGDVELVCMPCHKLGHFAKPDHVPPRWVPVYLRPPGRRDHRLRAIVKVIRAGTVCERCGSQPIEYHNHDHREHPERRIGNMVGRGRWTLADIVAEIERCEALCRRCHAHEDGHILRSRPPSHSGESNGRARLTREQVDEIRERFGAGRQLTHAEIGKLYGVSRPTIGHVLSGATWSV